MRHYYIYYRIPVEQTAAIESALQRIQFEIMAQLGISGRLLKKRDDPNLWLEVYENVPENSAFEEVLQQAESQVGFSDLLAPGEIRQLECFQD